MDGSLSADILTQEGFWQIGRFDHRVRLELWWRPESKMQLIVLTLGSKTLLKGCKSYVMQSISEEGETYARDINQLHEYLETHFPEAHIAFSYFRDVPRPLAELYLARSTAIKTPTVPIPSVVDLASLQSQIDRARHDAESLADLARLASDGGQGLVTSYVNKKVTAGRRTVKSLKKEQQRLHRRFRRFEGFQKAYMRQGSAASYTFTIGSNLQLARSPLELRDAISDAVKEITDSHRFQITQKLSGGRLNIQIAECDEPHLSWIEHWMGGALSPTQMQRLQPDFAQLRATANERLMVTADTNIKSDGHVVEPRKRLGARAFLTLVRRLDREGVDEPMTAPPRSAMPLLIGKRLQGKGALRETCVLPLVGANHIYASGTTGSGKSYLGRVITEEAASISGLSVLVLDPRNQSAGLLAPEDRTDVLARYPDFDMHPDQAHGVRFEYAAPGERIGRLPRALGDLSSGRHVISFKGMDDRSRCELFADILDAVFDQCAASESDAVRLLMVIEEAHRFTKKRVDESAKAAGARAENALDRLVREGRKFGICALIISQTVRDFAYDSASVRQNTTTKIFMRNSDREIEYAGDFIDNPKRLIALRPGEAICAHSTMGVFHARIRPPRSKVWEFSRDETLQLTNDPKAPSRTVSGEARQLLAVIEEHSDGVNVSALCDLAGVSSKRRMQLLIQELEEGGLVVSKRLRARGAPRLIQAVAKRGASGLRTKPRTQGGPNRSNADAKELNEERNR